jgi:hypothetical protein
MASIFEQTCCCQNAQFWQQRRFDHLDSEVLAAVLLSFPVSIADLVQASTPHVFGE